MTEIPMNRSCGVMDRILLQLSTKRDRRQIEDWLGNRYQIILGSPDHPIEGPFDLAVVDGGSLKAHMARIEARRLAEEPVLLPFLLMTARRPGSMPSRHLGAVVDDIIFRPLHERELRARVANLLRMRNWSIDLKKEHDRAMKLAVTDDVSGFNNTRYLHRYLDRVIAPEGEPPEVCLVFFDLDNFKSLVDAHGHLLGSKALKEVAQVASKVLDEDDRLVRYGGDEFIVILPRQNKNEALAKVSRIREAINRTPFLRKEGIDEHLTASFGVACCPHDARNKHELLAAADRCLFMSKSAGKDQVTSADCTEPPVEEPSEAMATADNRASTRS